MHSLTARSLVNLGVGVITLGTVGMGTAPNCIGSVGWRKAACGRLSKPRLLGVGNNGTGLEGPCTGKADFGVGVVGLSSLRAFFDDGVQSLEDGFSGFFSQENKRLPGGGNVLLFSSCTKMKD